MAKILLSQRHPFFYSIAVWVYRTKRYLSYFFDRKKYARNFQQERFPYKVKEHSSVLIRKLGDSDIELQYNKIKNLAIAIKNLNGIIIKPGETFSFCRLVGLPTRKKGYVEGMELSHGIPRRGIGGGICQITNLIYWLALHSDLTISERHHHGFDPFPDNCRVLPFGTGASIFFNYIDLQLTNNTTEIFQINLRLTNKCLEGELRTSREPEFTYHIFEDKHEFLNIDGKYFRRNEIWRQKMLRKGGKMLVNELITKNFVEVKYTPSLNDNNS